MFLVLVDSQRCSDNFVLTMLIVEDYVTLEFFFFGFEPIVDVFSELIQIYSIQLYTQFFCKTIEFSTTDMTNPAFVVRKIIFITDIDEVPIINNFIMKIQTNYRASCARDAGFL